MAREVQVQCHERDPRYCCVSGHTGAPDRATWPVPGRRRRQTGIFLPLPLAALLWCAAMPPALKKRFGQHHLTNPGVCRPLLEFLAPLGDALVVEIGPGGGLLTGELLAAGARVWGVELDREWAFELPRALARRNVGAAVGTSLQPVVMDALELPWSRLPAGTLVCGNLPYNVGTTIVTTVVTQHDRVPRAAFLLQKEVAERLTAQPGSRSYGSLTVWTALHANARILGLVRPGAFRPPPKVDSAFVGLTLRPPPLPAGEVAAFGAFVREAFAQKRKTLRNTLAGRGRERVEAALAAVGLTPLARAEELPLATFLALFAALGAAARG
jgi:16S rRNA (adenine1518-N6/adenine1519-N6)-dimethyltransferase